MVEWNNFQVEVQKKMTESSKYLKIPVGVETVVKFNKDVTPINKGNAYTWRTVDGKEFDGALTISSLLGRAMNYCDGTVKVFHTSEKNSWKVWIQQGEEWKDVRSLP